MTTTSIAGFESALSPIVFVQGSRKQVEGVASRMFSDKTCFPLLQLVLFFCGKSHQPKSNDAHFSKHDHQLDILSDSTQTSKHKCGSNNRLRTLELIVKLGKQYALVCFLLSLFHRTRMRYTPVSNSYTDLLSPICYHIPKEPKHRNRK